MTTGSNAEVNRNKAATLRARDYKDAQIVTEAEYTVRRLTPTECAMLQGFPADWCASLETADPSEEDIDWWSEVFETHRKIMGKSKKTKSNRQIIKWLKNPYSEAAEYKMWGNGVALPCVRFVLAGIVWSVNNNQR
jgi:DNA (cytosine-5)-methyltransferase 1